MRNTNSRPDVTMLLQFSCYAIFQDFTDVVTITTTGRGIKVVTDPARRHDQHIRYQNFLNVREHAAR